MRCFASVRSMLFPRALGGLSASYRQLNVQGLQPDHNNREFESKS